MKVAGAIRKILGRRSEGTDALCSVVVPAAGSSRRMAGVNKLFEELGGMPVLARTLRALDACGKVGEIIVVTREEDIVAVYDLCRTYGVQKVTDIVVGGSTRMESVYIGVGQASADSSLIAVHDGARPLVTEDVISRAIDAAAVHTAAAPAVKVTSTVKRAVNHIVTETVDRETLFEIQTPQVFNADLLKAALQNAMDRGLTVTDDCMAVEAIGASVYLSEGSYENIKITTPTDLRIAEAILAERGEIE